MNDKAINTDLLFISIDLGLVHSGSNVKSAMSVRYDRSMLRGRLPLRCDPVVGGGRPHKSFAFTGCICSLLFGGLEAAFSRLSLLASFIAAGDLSPDHTHTQTPNTFASYHRSLHESLYRRRLCRVSLIAGGRRSSASSAATLRLTEPSAKHSMDAGG